MTPVIGRVNTEAYQPYRSGELTREEAFDRAQVPMKEFMLKQTEKKSLDLFLQISKTDPAVLEGEEGPERYMGLDLTVIVPSFIPVSYTHLDVYKRQIPRWRSSTRGIPDMSRRAHRRPMKGNSV